MTTEIEEQFFKVFGIEPYKLFSARQGINPDAVIYPEITDRKLLQLLCIYNNMQGYPEFTIIPCKYEDTKEMILQTLIDEKTGITDYEEDTYMDIMTKQIQQLFKEGE